MPDALTPNAQVDDVETMICHWRDRLAARGALSGEAIEELEDHLRAEWQNIVSSDLTAEERLLIASHRLGDVDRLAEQFKPVCGAQLWARRLRWMIAGYVLVFALNLVVFTPLKNLQIVGYQIFLDLGTVWSIALTCLGVFLAMAIGLAVAIPWCASRSQRRGGVKSPWSVMTRPWFLYTAIVGMPWLAVLIHRLGFSISLSRFTSAAEFGRFALADQITSLMIPFAAPLMVLIVASALQKKSQSSNAEM